jgi:hypothetical protein
VVSADSDANQLATGVANLHKAVKGGRLKRAPSAGNSVIEGTGSRHLQNGTSIDGGVRFEFSQQLNLNFIKLLTAGQNMDPI